MARATFSEMLSGLLETAEVWVSSERAYIAHGRAVADCESLVIWLERVDARQEAKPACQVQSIATFHVTRFLCAPTMEEDGSPLPASVYEASALQLADDGDAIWYGALSAWHDATLFGEELGIKCSEVDLTRGMVALDPSGGIAGWDLVIRVTL